MQPLQTMIDMYDSLSDKLSPSGWIDQQIHYILDVDGYGNLVSVIPTDKIVAVPAADSGRTSGIRPFTLWDKRAYIFGDMFGDPKDADRLSATKNYYASLPSEIVGPVLMFLHNNPAHQLTLVVEPSHPLLQGKTTKTNCIFRVLPSDDFLLHHPKIVELMQGKAASEFCHNKITRLNGANSSGASLVSYNLPTSSKHYHWSDNDLDMMSYADMLKYTAVANYLSKNQQIKLSDNLSMLYATDVSACDELDLMDAMFGYQSPTDDSTKIKSIISGIINGKFAASAGNLIIWTIRSNNGRAAMVDCKKITIPDFCNSIKRWHDVMGDTKLWQLLKLLDHPHVKSDLMWTIINGTPIPQYVVNLANTKLLSCNTQPREREILCKLLMLNREIKMESFGIIVGKLLMVYEAMQYSASGGNINVNVTEKYMRGLCNNTNATLQKIAELSVNWSNKLKREGKNVFYDRMIDDLMAELAVIDRSKIDKLDIHIGYHLQRSKIFKPKAVPALDTSVQAP